MEVRFAEFQMNDGAPLALQFLRASEDRERAFATHDRESFCQGAHQAFFPVRDLGMGVIGICNPSTRRGNNSNAAAAATSSTICASVYAFFNCAKNLSSSPCAERCTRSAQRKPSFSDSVNGPDSKSACTAAICASLAPFCFAEIACAETA